MSKEIEAQPDCLCLIEPDCPRHDTDQLKELLRRGTEVVAIHAGNWTDVERAWFSEAYALTKED